LIEFPPAAVSTWGSVFVFLNVLLTRLGVPIPAVPVLLFAGSAIAGGSLSFPVVLLAAVLAALIGDAVWFALGRIYGRRLIAALARFAPAVHRKVDKARALFERFGVPLVSISKFVPGLGLITPPLMGTTAVDVRIYAAWDIAGAVVWASFWLLGGAAAEKQLHMLLTVVRAHGGTVIDVLVVAALGYLLWRVVQRRRERKRHALASAATQTNSDDALPPIVLDTRPQKPQSAMQDPAQHAVRRGIPGVIALDPDSPAQLEGALRACERVLYCICADHTTARDVMERMRSNGYTRIRALSGGLDAWQRRGFPVEPRVSPPAPSDEFLSAQHTTQVPRMNTRRERFSAVGGNALRDDTVTLRGVAPRRSRRA
jgi:membrane protein DedA with SNARE-associated domain/rhodanese-related sulfurtransferase